MRPQRQSALTFAVEDFSSFYSEALDLLRLHWEEIAPYKELLALNPDLDMYKTLDVQGKLVVITARAAGALVGYIVLIITAHHHYSHVLMATEDIHFLHPAYRKGLAGLRLIRAGEAEMKRRRVQLIALRTKVASDHGLLMRRLGYDAQDVVYTKLLGD